MTKRTITSITFSSCKSRKVQADFSGGEITSDAGVLLLRQADRRLQLTQRISRQMKDPPVRREVHPFPSGSVTQRAYAIC